MNAISHVVWLTLILLTGGALAEGAKPGLRLIGSDDGNGVDAPQLGTDVSIAVSGMLIRATVVQRFVNPGDSWVEGIYTFPLPENAAVDRLQLRYAGRLIQGEIQERRKARRKYELARDEGRAATLLGQQRANMFTTSVANIPPGETVEVTIAYQQHATWRDREYSLRFPMVVAPRYIPGTPVAARTRIGPAGWAADTDQVADASAITPPVVVGAGKDFNPVSLRVDLDVGLPTAGIESPYHEIVTNTLSRGRYRVRLAQGSVPADRDFELRWRPQLGYEPTAALFSQRWRDRHFGLLMVMPPHDLAVAPPIARELILVVDTSGSMHGESIGQARAALHQALRQLRPGDRFNVVQFNDKVHSLFAGAVPADAAHLQQAQAYIAGLQAEGGTEMLPAMRHALRSRDSGERLRQVIFLTDGAIGNEQALFELIAQRIGNSRLFTVGIGSAPNALFMRKAARHGRGTFSYIGDADEVEEKMASLFLQLAAPVLTDVQLHWLTTDGRPVDGQAPQRIPDLYADEPMVVSVRSPSGLQKVRIEGRLGNRPWTRTVTLHDGATADGVHALWARHKIDDHLARLLLGDEADAVRADVLSLALEHHLVSRYTSLVAVDRTPTRPATEGVVSGRLATRLPAGWSGKAVFGRLPSTATPAVLWLIVSLLSLGVALLARRRS